MVWIWSISQKCSCVKSLFANWWHYWEVIMRLIHWWVHIEWAIGGGTWLENVGCWVCAFEGFLFICFLLDTYRVWLCVSDWPETMYCRLASNLYSPASGFQVLGLQACSTTHSLWRICLISGPFLSCFLLPNSHEMNIFLLGEIRRVVISWT
jgi:hypothetical protein